MHKSFDFVNKFMTLHRSNSSKASLPAVEEFPPNLALYNEVQEEEKAKKRMSIGSSTSIGEITGSEADEDIVGIINRGQSEDDSEESEPGHEVEEGVGEEERCAVVVRQNYLCNLQIINLLKTICNTTPSASTASLYKREDRVDANLADIEPGG